MRAILLGLVTLAISGEPAAAFRIGDAGPALGASAAFPIRWDAAPRTAFGEERSLDGGLRYSVEGGSYEAFRDQFQWYTVPTVSEFQGAVEAAFAAWESVDPVTGLGTPCTSSRTSRPRSRTTPASWATPAPTPA